MQELTITIPLPPRDSHPNARPKHWAQKARAKDKQRGEAKLAALEALQGKRAPRWRAATIHAAFTMSHKAHVRADSDNLIAWLKATADGLQDAGVIHDDAGFQWLAPSQLFGNDANGKKPGVVLTIRDDSPAAERALRERVACGPKLQESE